MTKIEYATKRIPQKYIAEIGEFFIISFAGDDKTLVQLVRLEEDSLNFIEVEFGIRYLVVNDASILALNKLYSQKTCDMSFVDISPFVTNMVASGYAVTPVNVTITVTEKS